MPDFPFDVVLDNVRSALNVGAIFRTCDAAGVRKLYLSGITPYPPHNRIPKTALGAIELVEWEKVDNTLELVMRLKSEGTKVYAVEQSKDSRRFDSIEYPENTAIVFGHEISGVSKEVLAEVDGIVEVPMFGDKESLNVATTVGIVSYHLALRYEAGQST